MYSNMKEKVVFTLIMCSLMILCMSSYNIFLENGIGTDSLMIILKAFVPFLFIGFLLDFLLSEKLRIVCTPFWLVKMLRNLKRSL